MEADLASFSFETGPGGYRVVGHQIPAAGMAGVRRSSLDCTAQIYLTITAVPGHL